MVTLWPNEYGQRVVDAVGGNGMTWNIGKSVFLSVLAYPAMAPYDGGWQEYCSGDTRPYGAGQIDLRCYFTGGASGAAWLKDYNGNVGYSNGVMSTLDPGTGWNQSPYFDDKARQIFEDQGNVT